eukprot:7298250-Ditylum_brightwellii.AAC.1
MAPFFSDGSTLMCVSLTKLETGCAGLCIMTLRCPPSPLRDSPLQSANDKGDEGNITKKDSFDPGNDNKECPQNERLATGNSDILVVYTFKALVHGIVPEEWMKQENTSNLDSGGGGGGVWVDLPSEDNVRRWKRKKNDNEMQMQDFDTAIKQQKKGDKDDSSMMAIYNSHDNNTIDEDNGEEAKANQNADLVLKKKSSFSDSTDANNFKKVQNVQLQCHGKTIGTTKFEEKQKTQ